MQRITGFFPKGSEMIISYLSSCQQNQEAHVNVMDGHVLFFELLKVLAEGSVLSRIVYKSLCFCLKTRNNEIKR